MNNSTSSGSVPPPLPHTGSAEQNSGAADSRAAPPVGQSYKGMAVGSLVCSIVGIVSFPVILGTIAMVLGTVARSKMRRANNRAGENIAFAGQTIGGIEFAVSTFFFIVEVSSR
jgi:hypothetical protein